MQQRKCETVSQILESARAESKQQPFFFQKPEKIDHHNFGTDDSTTRTPYCHRVSLRKKEAQGATAFFLIFSSQCSAMSRHVMCSFLQM